MAGSHFGQHNGRPRQPVYKYTNKMWCSNLAEDLGLDPVFVYKVFLTMGGDYRKVREYCLDYVLTDLSDCT